MESPDQIPELELSHQSLNLVLPLSTSTYQIKNTMEF